MRCLKSANNRIVAWTLRELARKKFVIALQTHRRFNDLNRTSAHLALWCLRPVGLLRVLSIPSYVYYEYLT